MRRFIVITRPDQVDGFRLTGTEAIAVNDAQEAQRLIAEWMEQGQDILLALDDAIFSSIEKSFIKRIYDSNHIILVTIPDGPMHGTESTRKKRMYDIIRHATGIKFSFKGEDDTHE